MSIDKEASRARPRSETAATVKWFTPRRHAFLLEHSATRFVPTARRRETHKCSTCSPRCPARSAPLGAQQRGRLPRSSSMFRDGRPRPANKHLRCTSPTWEGTLRGNLLPRDPIGEVRRPLKEDGVPLGDDHSSAWETSSVHRDARPLIATRAAASSSACARKKIDSEFFACYGKTRADTDKLSLLPISR